VLCAAAATPAATSGVLCAGQRLLRTSQPVLQREISSRAEVVISPVAVREQGISVVAGTAAVAPYYLIKHRHRFDASSCRKCVDSDLFADRPCPDVQLYPD